MPVFLVFMILVGLNMVVCGNNIVGDIMLQRQPASQAARQASKQPAIHPSTQQQAGKQAGTHTHTQEQQQQQRQSASPREREAARQEQPKSSSLSLCSAQSLTLHPSIAFYSERASESQSGSQSVGWLVGQKRSSLLLLLYRFCQQSESSASQ